VQREKTLLKRFLAILAAYALATYVEALSWFIFLVREGAEIGALLQPKAILTFVLSPILFPIKYSAFLRVRSTGEFASVLSLDVAPLVTFVAAFIGSYLYIRDRQRRRPDSLPRRSVTL
jgi:hypothetical protein